MSNEELRAHQLVELERSLNKVTFENVQIGSIMAVYWGILYGQRPHAVTPRLFLSIIYIHLKSLFQNSKTKDFEKPFVYIKTGNTPHLQNLKSAVLYNSKIKQATLIIESDDIGGIPFKDISRGYKLKDIITVWVFMKRNFKHINNLLKWKDFNFRTRMFLFLNLFIQLIKTLAILNFLKNQKKLSLIGGDYDRGHDTAPLFAAAKSLDILSFTLQHGVINPPYGYHPLIANEIWVWGDMAKEQLLSLGVSKKDIRLVGTPIIQDIEISKTRRQGLFNCLHLKKGNNVVLALSYPDINNDRLLVRFLHDIQKLYRDENDNFLVKLHPARNPEDYKWITKNFGFAILPNSMEQVDFMNLVDILLVHSSGIATEAFYFGIRVGILDILSISPGNGLELHKYFNVPLLKKVSDFGILRDASEIKLKNTKIYYSTGRESKNKISKLIYEKIYSKAGLYTH